MQYLLHQKFPKDIADLISEYLPAHPMKAKIMYLSMTRRCQTNFYKWYFNSLNYKDTSYRKYKEDFWFKRMNEDGYTNEQAIKLRYKSKLEKAELIEELTALNLKLYQVRQVCHFGEFNRYGRMMEVYRKDKQIIF
jgi:hypothetical protein